MIRDFADKFTAIHGTMNCKELLNSDLKTEEGRRYVHENKLDVTVCQQCIVDAVKIVDEMAG